MIKEEDKYLNQLFARAKQEADQEGRESHVVELLSQYVQHKPSHQYAWLLYGDALRVLGRFQEAQPALKKALQLSSEDQRDIVCARIGMLYENQRSRAEAEEWYKLALQNAGKQLGWLWVFRGANLAAMEQYEEALACHRRAILTEDVDEDEAYLNLGLVFRAMGRYEEAIEAFRRALEINPAYAEAKTALDGLHDIRATIIMATRMQGCPAPDFTDPYGQK